MKKSNNEIEQLSLDFTTKTSSALINNKCSQVEIIALQSAKILNFPNKVRKNSKDMAKLYQEIIESVHHIG